MGGNLVRCPPTLQAAQVCAAGPPGRRRRKPRGTSRAWGKETVDQMRDLVAGMVGKRLMYPDLTK